MAPGSRRRRLGIEFARIESLNSTPLFIKALAAVVGDAQGILKQLREP